MLPQLRFSRLSLFTWSTIEKQNSCEITHVTLPWNVPFVVINFHFLINFRRTFNTFFRSFNKTSLYFKIITRVLHQAKEYLFQLRNQSVCTNFIHNSNILPLNDQSDTSVVTILYPFHLKLITHYNIVAVYFDVDC